MKHIDIAENIIYELWFTIAETLFKKICEVTQLDSEQIDALTFVALRPNDFIISIT